MFTSEFVVVIDLSLKVYTLKLLFFFLLRDGKYVIA